MNGWDECSLSLACRFLFSLQTDIGCKVNDGEASATRECDLHICGINREDRLFNRQKGKKTPSLVVYFSGSLGKARLSGVMISTMICLGIGTDFH